MKVILKQDVNKIGKSPMVTAVTTSLPEGWQKRELQAKSAKMKSLKRPRRSKTTKNLSLLKKLRKKSAVKLSL